MTATWDPILEHAREFRHRLHQRPELTWHETATAAAIRRELDQLGLAWRACAETGTLATVNPNGAGRHVALRADIDALPISEDSGVAWSSQHPGVMHACGHDGHTATLLAAAMWLNQHAADLPGPVTLLFQPAEEGGYGAQRMIADGALNGIDVIFGWHNWPAIPFGQALCPDGPVMCANGSFELLVIGRGGHASQPEACRDPVLAAAAITLALQQIASRRVAPQEPVVVSVASIMADSMDTIIPGQALVRGSIRAASTAVRDAIEQAITDVATATARAYGVTVEVTHAPRYGATVNHNAPAAEYRTRLAQEFGDQWQNSSIAVPLMASEDFSYYLEKVPGAFAIIGAGRGDDDPPCHSAHYDFNDALLAPVARLFTRLAQGQ